MIWIQLEIVRSDIDFNLNFFYVLLIAKSNNYHFYISRILIVRIDPENMLAQNMLNRDWIKTTITSRVKCRSVQSGDSLLYW